MAQVAAQTRPAPVSPGPSPQDSCSRSAQAWPAEMRVTAGMREVVGTRATFADCNTHPANVGADSRHQDDDRQPPSGTATARLYTAQLPFSSVHMEAPATCRCRRFRRAQQARWLLRAYDSCCVPLLLPPWRARSPSWRS